MRAPYNPLNTKNQPDEQSVRKRQPQGHKGGEFGLFQVGFRSRGFWVWAATWRFMVLINQVYLYL